MGQVQRERRAQMHSQWEPSWRLHLSPVWDSQCIRSPWGKGHIVRQPTHLVETDSGAVNRDTGNTGCDVEQWTGTLETQAGPVCYGTVDRDTGNTGWTCVIWNSGPGNWKQLQDQEWVAGVAGGGGNSGRTSCAVQQWTGTLETQDLPRVMRSLIHS